MPKNIAQARARINGLLLSRRISQEDHKMLLIALGGQQRSFQKLFAIAINPLEYVSSGIGTSLGVLFLIVLSYVGTKCRLYFPGVLDLKVYSEGHDPFNPIALLKQNAVDVLALSLTFYFGAQLSGSKNLRFLDFIGSMSLARFPYVTFALGLWIFQLAFPNIALPAPESQELIGSIVLALIAVSFVAWQMAIIFNGLRTASGLSGSLLWFNFILGIIFAEAVSYGLNMKFLQ